MADAATALPMSHFANTLFTPTLKLHTVKSNKFLTVHVQMHWFDVQNM